MDNEIKPVEIKDLNKTQLILLAILLSFVVSIATGIVTVTLMQQASPAVNQTINRVVQHTIEKVVPDYTPGKTQTVVIKEDDLIVDAIEKVRSTIAPIILSQDATIPALDSYYFGSGVFVASSFGLDIAKTYQLSVGEKKIEAKIFSQSPFGFSTLIASKPDELKTFPVVSLGKDTENKSGQTIAIVDSSFISKDIIQSILQKEEKDEAGKVLTSWKVISTGSLQPLSAIGSLVVNVDGDAIGMVLPKGDMGTQIIGIGTIEKAVTEAVKNPAKPALSAQALPATE